MSNFWRQPTEADLVRAAEAEEYAREVIARLESMSLTQRAIVLQHLGRFCASCGADDPFCPCENDE